MNEALLQMLLRLNLAVPVRRTQNGAVTEYALTHAGRVFLARTMAADEVVQHEPLIVKERMTGWY